MSDFVVPDMVEPVIAWRKWRVSSNGLHSLNNFQVWPMAERMEAYCGGSEPTELKVVGWEAVPHRGEACWLRDGFEGERLEHSHSPRTGMVGMVVSSAVTVAAMTPAPVMHIEPLPERPSALILPVGWKFRIGHRSIMLPPRHTVSPAEGCSCGIYALKTKAATKGYPGDLVGEVYLWGKVIEGEDGYRAQYAYPKSLHELRDLFDYERDAISGYEVGDKLDELSAEPDPMPWWRIW